MEIALPYMEVVIPARHHHPFKDFKPLIKSSDSSSGAGTLLKPIVILILRVKRPDGIPEPLASAINEDHRDPSVNGKLRGGDEGGGLLQSLNH